MFTKRLSRVTVYVVSFLVFMLLYLGQYKPVYAADTIKLNKTSISVVVGASRTLKVSGTNSKVEWSTSDKKIATVNSKGIMKAIKKGTATITAKVGSTALSCKVKVYNKSDRIRVFLFMGSMIEDFSISTVDSLMVFAEEFYYKDYYKQSQIVYNTAGYKLTLKGSIFYDVSKKCVWTTASIGDKDSKDCPQLTFTDIDNTIPRSGEGEIGLFVYVKNNKIIKVVSVLP